MGSWFRLHYSGLMKEIACPNPALSCKKCTVYPEFGGGIMLDSEGLRPRCSISNPPTAINLGQLSFSFVFTSVALALLLKQIFLRPRPACCNWILNDLLGTTICPLSARQKKFVGPCISFEQQYCCVPFPFFSSWS